MTDTENTGKRAKNSPHILIVESRFYEDISDELMRGAASALKKAGATCEKVSVPGALEIPAAIRYALRARDFSALSKRFDGYIVLGCVIRGETTHYDIVTHECARGVMDLVKEYTLALGFGLLTCENKAQALERAGADKKDYGGRAARTCLRMLAVKGELQLRRK